MINSHIRTFSQPVSKDTTLEIGFIDFGEESQVTSVILILNSHSSHPSYRHITKKVFKSMGLYQYCNNAMMNYLSTCSDYDVNEDLNAAI